MSGNLSLVEWNRALDQLAAQCGDPDYARAILAMQSKSDRVRDPYDEALSLLHLKEEDPLPVSTANFLESFFTQAARTRPEAWNDLGVLYYLEQSPLRNLKKAFAAFLKGEEDGSPDAMLNLGFFYRYDHGKDFPVDLKKAWCCFSKCSLYGIAQGMLQLALMLENGLGFEADRHTALILYRTILEQLDDPLEEPALFLQSELGAARILDLEDSFEGRQEARVLIEEALAFVEELSLEGKDQALDEQIEQARQQLAALVNPHYSLH